MLCMVVSRALQTSSGTAIPCSTYNRCQHAFCNGDLLWARPVEACQGVGVCHRQIRLWGQRTACTAGQIREWDHNCLENNCWIGPTHLRVPACALTVVISLSPCKAQSSDSHRQMQNRCSLEAGAYQSALVAVKALVFAYQVIGLVHLRWLALLCLKFSKVSSAIRVAK